MQKRWSDLGVRALVLIALVFGVSTFVLAADGPLEFTKGPVIKDLGNGQTLRRPMSIVVDSQMRIITNDTSDRVLILSPDGKLLKTFGKKGKKDGQFRDTFGLAIDKQDRIYVSDTGNYRVQVFDKDGNFLSKFGSKGNGDDQFMRPGSMAISGDTIFVVDIDSHRVSAWTLDGKHLFNFGQRGTKEGQFLYPQGIAVGSDGSVYVVDGLNFRVEIFDVKGNYQDKFGKQGDTEGTFSRPKGIAITADDQVFVADGLLNLVEVVDTAGEYLGKIGGDTEAAIFAQPYGVWLDKNHRVYVADRGDDEIMIFDPVSPKK